MVQGLYPGHCRQVEVGQDVQRLAIGGAAAGRRRHPVHVVAAIVHVRRGAHQRGVVTQVADPHQSRTRRDGRAGHERQVLDGVDDVAAEPAAVEVAGPEAADLLVRVCEVRVAECRAHHGQLAARHEQVPGRAELDEPERVFAHLLTEGRVDREALERDSLGGTQNLAPGSASPTSPAPSARSSACQARRPTGRSSPPPGRRAACRWPGR